MASPLAGAPGADLRSQTHVDRHARGRHERAGARRGILRHRVVGRRASRLERTLRRGSRGVRGDDAARPRARRRRHRSRASPTDTSSAAARTASSPCGLAYRTPPTPPLPPSPAPRSSLRERRRPPGTSPDAPDAPDAPEPEPERAEPTADPDEDGITPEERSSASPPSSSGRARRSTAAPTRPPSPRADFPRASTPPLASSRFSRFTSVPTTTPARWTRTRPST